MTTTNLFNIFKRSLIIIQRMNEFQKTCHDNIKNDNTDTKELNQKPPSQQLKIVDALEEISNKRKNFAFLDISTLLILCNKFTSHAQQ